MKKQYVEADYDGNVSTIPQVRAHRNPAASVTFTAIYAQQFGYVWQSLRRLGVRNSDLPDLTHDVFVRAYRRIHTYDNTRPIKPWLFGVLFRTASEHFRRASYLHEVFDDVPDVADSNPMADLVCAAREEWRFVDRALLRIPLSHRTVIVMYDVYGHRGPEIARALGIPCGTVYSRLKNARLRFAELADARREKSRENV
jgi:RNA polymerase sigma-70 factor (ECF subfamily)